MKNCRKSKNWKLLGIVVILTVAAITLSGCMSMLMGLAKTKYKDYGVYDKSVPEDQMCELRFGLIIIKSFNETPVNWGNTPNSNMGHIKIPAGVHTIVFDWVQETTQMTGSSRSGNTITNTYTTTTRSLRNITFSDVNMLPGHNYFIGGGKINDGDFRFWLLDQTSAPSGFYGDIVPKAPKKSKVATELEGKWKNNFGETFEFLGNTWVQTLPPYVGQNTGPNQLCMRGLFELSNGKMTLFWEDTSVDGVMWVNIKSMENVYYYNYALNGNNLLLELPYMLPEITYMKQ